MAKVLFNDPVMQALTERVLAAQGELEVIEGISPDEYFQNLSESIIGQQLSNKVADTIVGRARAVIGAEFTPTAVLAVDIEEFRKAGLSYAKARYLHNLAQAWVDGLISPANYPDMTDEEIITDLTQVKGIGRWTAEMFLIFTLGRPDVFSVGDFALRKAVVLAYGLGTGVKPADILQVTEEWTPNRSYASRILWRSLELK